MRGKLSWVAIQIFSVGITPADAGKTLIDEIQTEFNRDHPRGCGENGKRNSATFSAMGSPPRMRGKLTEVVLLLQILGITPADAGKT